MNRLSIEEKNHLNKYNYILDNNYLFHLNKKLLAAHALNVLL